MATQGHDLVAVSFFVSAARTGYALSLHPVPVVFIKLFFIEGERREPAPTYLTRHFTSKSYYRLAYMTLEAFQLITGRLN